jgi:hypothetical protein
MKTLVFIAAGLLAGVAVLRAADPPPKDAWVYKQSTGELYLNGKLVGKGYSGNGKGLNNLDLEKEKNVGPIPRGEWKIGEAFKHDTKGPTVMRLTPVGHDAHGRSGFLIHGDNKEMDHTASDGCIVLGPDIRKQIADCTVKRLLVEK